MDPMTAMTIASFASKFLGGGGQAQAQTPMPLSGSPFNFAAMDGGRKGPEFAKGIRDAIKGAKAVAPAGLRALSGEQPGEILRSGALGAIPGMIAGGQPADIIRGGGLGLGPSLAMKGKG